MSIAFATVTNRCGVQSRVEQLESENSLLRCNPDVDVTVVLRDRMQFASQQLDSSANDAEQLLKYYYYYYYYYITPIQRFFFKNNMGKPVPERQNHSGF